MRAISKAQLRDFFSIGSIVLAAISAEFSISRSILALYNNNSRQSIKKMLVSQQHALFAEIVPQTAQSLDAVNICVPTVNKAQFCRIIKPLWTQKQHPPTNPTSAVFFIGIVLFGREVITLSNPLALRLRKQRIYRTKKAPLQVLLGFWFYFAAQR